MFAVPEEYMGAAVVSSTVVLLFRDVFIDALVALGGVQLFERKDDIEGVVIKDVCAGSANGAAFSDNNKGSAAHIEGNRPPRAIKAISTIIYLMEVRLLLRCL